MEDITVTFQCAKCGSDKAVIDMTFRFDTDTLKNGPESKEALLCNENLFTVRTECKECGEINTQELAEEPGDAT